MTAPKLAKVCAVVGVGPGLGRALCERFGREGFEIAMLARSYERLEALRHEFVDEGISAHVFAADAGDPESLRDALTNVQNTLGSPDVLIYNAVAFHPGMITNLTGKELADDLQTSVIGVLEAAKQLLPAMIERNQGALIFTGGGAGVNPWPQNASLSVGKAALRMLTLNLAAELKDSGVRVATVTVVGSIGGSERFAPERIAETYWDLYTEQQAGPEVVYR